MSTWVSAVHVPPRLNALPVAPDRPGPVSRQAPAYDPSNADHVLLGDVLGFDAEGNGLWDDYSYFEGDFSFAYEDIHGERIDIEYLIFLQCKGLPYYGKGGGPARLEVPLGRVRFVLRALPRPARLSTERIT